MTANSSHLGKPKQGWDRHLSWRWLYPGVRLKRWIFLLVLSAIVLGVGISGMMGDIFRNFEDRGDAFKKIAENL